MVCIYGIKNTENGKMYIGSTNDMTRRFKRHRTELRNGKHSNSYLQRAWNKAGEDSIDFVILTTCGEHQLLREEIKYIKKHNSLDSNFGYNLVIPLNVATRNISKEHSKKISDIMKGRTPNNFETMRRRRWTSVDVYKNSVFYKNYKSVMLAERSLGIGKGNIHNYLQGKTKGIRGFLEYHFEKKEEKV